MATTEVEQAVDRLSRIKACVEKSQDIYAVAVDESSRHSVHAAGNLVKRLMLDDERAVIDTYLRKTDTTPVDSDWLLSVCEQEADGFDGEPHYFMSGYHTDTELQIIVSPVGDGYELRLDPYKLANPTRGMVVSLCRLFGVTVEVKP